MTKNNTCTHFAEHSWQAGNNLALSVSVNYESGLCKLANGSDSRHVSNALAFRFKISAVSAARVHHFYVSESASMQIHPRSPHVCAWFSAKSLDGARSCPQRHHSVSTASSVIRLSSNGDVAGGRGGTRTHYTHTRGLIRGRNVIEKVLYNCRAVGRAPGRTV